MIIHTNLHHIRKQKLQSISYTEHQWKIYVTDIFETGKGKYCRKTNFQIDNLFICNYNIWICICDIGNTSNSRSFIDKDNCNILQNVFDPNNSGAERSIGDVDVRLGKIKVATNAQQKYKTFYRDPELSLLPADLLGPHRHLYLVIFHPVHEDSFLACARINHRKPIHTK